ncbi:hypothetical protein HDU87_004708 [Geranomyces variabilis]|uniref:DNA helicase n=1 Tax=Geranomyces variabilis TaxID=109894 RepID=A0AAD5THY2_9FUNG|nr:hypothetical protein HDU87_004708 [Geranomyces variabilis]
MASSDTDVDSPTTAPPGGYTPSPRSQRRRAARKLEDFAADFDDDEDEDNQAGGASDAAEHHKPRRRRRRHQSEDEDEDSDFVPETPVTKPAARRGARPLPQAYPLPGPPKGPQAWTKLPPTPLLDKTKSRYGERKVYLPPGPPVGVPATPTASFYRSVEPFRYKPATEVIRRASQEGIQPHQALEPYHQTAAPVRSGAPAVSGAALEASVYRPAAVTPRFDSAAHVTRPAVTPVLSPGAGYPIAKRPRSAVTDRLPSVAAALGHRPGAPPVATARGHWAPWTAEATKVPRAFPSPVSKVPSPAMSSLDRGHAELMRKFPEQNSAILRGMLQDVGGDVEKATETALEYQAANFNGQPKRRKLVQKKNVRPRPVRAESVTEVMDDSGSNADDSATDIDDPPAPEHRESDLDRRTLEFFNTAEPAQMSEALTCSPQQGALIVSLRPFESFSHLEDKLTGIKGQRGLASLPTRYQEVLEGYGEVDHLISQCEKFGDDVIGVLRSWTSKDPSALKAAKPEAASDERAEISLTHVDDDVLAEEAPTDGSADVDIGSGGKHRCLRRQPSVINPALPLKSYQLVGISWLYMLHSKGLGGILADEMGLGKTAQVISFLGYLKVLGKDAGPHLIVVPASTLENWRREINKWCPSLKTASYYGKQAERRAIQDDIYNDLDDGNVDIVLTTYNLCTGAQDDRSFLRKLHCKSLILDEGHMVKNMNSARYKHLTSFKAPFRLLLTGTPLQNNLMELLALLSFIMPKLFSNIGAITKLFNVTNPGESGFLSKQRIERAKKIMAPFVLRRKKAQVLTDLPAKTQEVVLCTATDRQRKLYEGIIAESRQTMLDAAAASASANATASETVKPRKGKRKSAAAPPPQTGIKGLSNVLMQLRKAADHPLLFRRHYTDDKLWLMSQQIMKEDEYMDANRQFIYEDMQVMSDFELHGLCSRFKSISKHKLDSSLWMDAGKVQTLQPLLLEMRERGDRVLLFSQFVMMLDILEAVLTTMGVKYLRLDGSTGVNDRQDIIDDYNDSPDVTVFLLSTKAGGFGINLTSANVVVIYDMDFNPHCFSEDTRLLTNQGFLFGCEIRERLAAGEKLLFACHDIASDALVYRPCKGNKLSVDFIPADDIVSFTSAAERPRWASEASNSTLPEECDASNGVSLLVTRNHRVYAQWGLDRDSQPGTTGLHVRTSDNDDRGSKPPLPFKKVDADFFLPSAGGVAALPTPRSTPRSSPQLSSSSFSTHLAVGHEPWSGRGLKLPTAAAGGVKHDAGDRTQFLDLMKSLGLQPCDLCASNSHVSPHFELTQPRPDCQVLAFLELYGFWLGKGRLKLGDGGVHSYGVMFHQLAKTDAQMHGESDDGWLQAQLAACGLLAEEYRYEYECDAEQRPSTIIIIERESWIGYFQSLYAAERGGCGDGSVRGWWFAPWVLSDLSKPQLRWVLRGLCRADGGWRLGDAGVSTSSAKFRDQLMVAVMHAGMSPRASSSLEPKGRWRVSFDPAQTMVTLFPASDVTTVEPPKLQRAGHDDERAGRVWCVEVDHPDHLVVAQRARQTRASGFMDVLQQSRPVIVGNCDAQAEDRAHRVGQTREVRVMKMVLDKSVEQHILKRAEAKLKLDERVQAEQQVAAVDENGEVKETAVADDEEDTSYVLECLRAELKKDQT